MLIYGNKLLKHLGMPSPNRTAAISTCVELDREQSYNTIDLLSYVQTNISKLTSEQKGIYDQIIHCSITKLEKSSSWMRQEVLVKRF